MCEYQYQHDIQEKQNFERFKKKTGLSKKSYDLLFVGMDVGLLWLDLLEHGSETEDRLIKLHGDEVRRTLEMGMSMGVISRHKRGKEPALYEALEG
jgi:hypothetical protein